MDSLPRNNLFWNGKFRLLYWQRIKGLRFLLSLTYFHSALQVSNNSVLLSYFVSKQQNDQVNCKFNWFLHYIFSFSYVNKLYIFQKFGAIHNRWYSLWWQLPFAVPTPTPHIRLLLMMRMLEMVMIITITTPRAMVSVLVCLYCLDRTFTRSRSINVTLFTSRFWTSLSTTIRIWFRSICLWFLQRTSRKPTPYFFSHPIKHI